MNKAEMIKALESFEDNAEIVINLDGEGFVRGVTVSRGVFDRKSECEDCHVGCPVPPPEDGCEWLYMCDGKECEVDVVVVIG